LASAAARASLTASEAEQVHRAVQTASDLPRARALVARPDLTPDEAAAAIAVPLTTTPLDDAHVAFLTEFVFGDEAAASRPVLAVAALRAVLARADAVLGQHALDLERTPAALAELGRAYAFVEKIAAAGPAANVPASAKALCAGALAEHVKRNATVLGPESSVGPRVHRTRAQVAIAYLDFVPDTPTRRIDAAAGLALSGARRALLVERGVLALDAAGADERAAAVRALFDRLPALHDGVEAIVVQGGDPAAYVARDGTVLTTSDDPGGEAGRVLLWGNDVRNPPGDGWTTAVARSLATAAVSRVVAKNEALRAQVERDGGVSGVSAMAAMLILNGPLAVETAAARLLSGRKEATACLADAVAALAFTGSPPGPPGTPTVRVGPAKPTASAAELTKIALDRNGAARSFRLADHNWLIDRNASGAVTGMQRDGVPVTAAMLAANR
jgi:hypothetical protein